MDYGRVQAAVFGLREPVERELDLGQGVGGGGLFFGSAGDEREEGYQKRVFEHHGNSPSDCEWDSWRATLFHSGAPVQRLSKKVLKLLTVVNSPKPSNVQNRMQAKR